jgi:hypothetical protein
MRVKCATMCDSSAIHQVPSFGSSSRILSVPFVGEPRTSLVSRGCVVAR